MSLYGTEWRERGYGLRYGTEWRDRGYGLCGVVCPDPVAYRIRNGKQNPQIAKSNWTWDLVKVESDLGFSKGRIRLITSSAPHAMKC
jgi:hypothetical protein